jgi:hypothetical protein
MSEMTFCSSCGRQIRFVLTAKNRKPIPIDAQPVAGGNLDIDEDGLVVYVKPEPEVVRFVSHFATCPNAASHRKKR